MSIKHALVVDDSRSARFALKKLLEDRELVVEMAESGEEALEFLKHQTVDVIFMDHTMPGMDGLAAVAAIKGNPRTAMIPVMMYTTKEGEVYVGQARALGAIGVLPKTVQPQALFDMLLSLGLVREKRSGEAPSGTAPQRRAGDPGAQAPAAAELTGFSLESLLRRILEDQHGLRSELKLRERELAKQIAAEVVEAQRVAALLMTPAGTAPAGTAPAGTAPAGTAPAGTAPAGMAAAVMAPAIPIATTAPSTAGWQLLVVLLAIAALWLGATAWQARDERDAARAQMTTGGADESAAAREIETALHAERTRGRTRELALLDALQWALNQNASFEYGDVPFDDDRAAELEALLARLAEVGFQGRIRLEAHLGEFCLTPDETGGYTLADADVPVEACPYVGHPLDDSSFVSERQTQAFASFVADSPLLHGSGIELDLVAHDREHSLRRRPFPPEVARAGDWNTIARANNRVEYTLIPTD